MTHPLGSKFESWSRILFVTSLALLCAACVAIGHSGPASIAAELDAELPGVVARGNSPSIQVSVISQGQIIWSEAFGQETSVDHVYMNASVQKVFTAVAVLQLVERGLVDLDADVQDYVPFAVRHLSFPETPVTVRMLLAQRSGLADFPYQFEWDTECAFSPEYRPSCPGYLVSMPLEDLLVASLTPGGANYDQQTWRSEPGQEYYYSVSAYPLLRYLVSQVTGESYAEYIHKNVFDPLGMVSSGFGVDEFAERHAIPYTRVGSENVELPMWSGQGWMMHTSADDMARFTCALLNEGQYDGYQLLQPETVELMKQKTSRFRVFLRSSDDLPAEGFGLGLFLIRSGWMGFGGSAPGYQSLLRFHPAKQVGYVIISNVNGILSGAYESARSDIYGVQDALVSILDPTLVVRYRAGEVLVFAGLGAIQAVLMRKKARNLVVVGGVWLGAGIASMFMGAPVAYGLLPIGAISLAWGGIGLLKARQDPPADDA